MTSNRNWMGHRLDARNNISNEYKDGVKEFIEFALKEKDSKAHNLEVESKNFHQMAPNQKKVIPGFFVRLDQTEKVYLPEPWCLYMEGDLPYQALLRNRFGDCWEVKVAHYKNTNMFWFEEGWRTFAEQNQLAINDHIQFKYNGKSTFDFQLFDENNNVKEYARIPNSKVEKQKERLQDMELENLMQEREEQPSMHLQLVESESEPHLETQSRERQDIKGGARKIILPGLLNI